MRARTPAPPPTTPRNPRGGSPPRSFAFALAAVLLAAPSPAAADPTGMWITEAEARTADAPDETDAKGAQPDVSEGPSIVLVRPEEGRRHGTPLDVLIRFEPRPDAEVDLGSLKVTYLKLVPIDITSRLREHVTAAGIDAKAVPIPAGRHRLRFAVRDTLARLSIRTLQLEVE